MKEKASIKKGTQIDDELWNRDILMFEIESINKDLLFFSTCITQLANEIKEIRKEIKNALKTR